MVGIKQALRLTIEEINQLRAITTTFVAATSFFLIGGKQIYYRVIHNIFYGEYMNVSRSQTIVPGLFNFPPET
jgi:hypothetical protein